MESKLTCNRFFSFTTSYIYAYVWYSVYISYKGLYSTLLVTAAEPSWQESLSPRGWTAQNQLPKNCVELAIHITGLVGYHDFSLIQTVFYIPEMDCKHIG